jgi:septal ring factor EnvC (AmiA/AmiB activator)
MWDEARQARLSRLLATEIRGTLTEAERTELATLSAERCRCEGEAIEAATRQTNEANARLEERLRQVQAQNQELEGLIREQEDYLAHVQALIKQIEERRRNWRERYAHVTGKPLDKPVGVEDGG